MSEPDELPPLPAPPSTGPKLERQIDPGAAKRFGKGGAGCLGVSALTLFLSGLQYVATAGPFTGMGLSMWLTAATFAAAAVTAWRGWVGTTLLLVAAAFTGPPLAFMAIRWVAEAL